MKFIFKISLLILTFWVVYGFSIPNNEWYITDKVGIFSQMEKDTLTSKIQEIEKTTSIEIAVLVVPTVYDDINLAAVDVGNQWGVGKKGQNNWLLLLIAVNDKKRSIQVGYWLEWTLPDLVTKRIGEARFPPNFREGNYYQGVFEMLDDTLWYIKQDPTLVQTYSQDTTSNPSFEKNFEIVFVIFFFAISVFGRLVTVPSIKGKWRKMKKYGRWIYAWVGFILSFLITWIIASFVISLFISYLFLLFGVLFSLYGNSPNGTGGIRFGWTGGGSWWWGWWFGWFGGGSFGGWWSSGSW